MASFDKIGDQKVLFRTNYTKEVTHVITGSNNRRWSKQSPYNLHR